MPRSGAGSTSSAREELDRSHLTIASDAEIKAHFTAQKPLFEALAKEFAGLTSIDVVNFDGRTSPAGAISPEQTVNLAQQLRSLTLGAAIRKYRDCDGCIALVIGGDGENQVGYLRVAPGALGPKMTPQSFIYVEVDRARLVPVQDGLSLWRRDDGPAIRRSRARESGDDRRSRWCPRPPACPSAWRSAWACFSSGRSDNSSETARC